MNVRSSNDVSCYPAPSEVDSNHGNPCSLVGNSLFPKSGNTPGGSPKSNPVTEAASPGFPDFGVFPCIFPANQGFAPRDEFATDCTLRHLVCCPSSLIKVWPTQPFGARASNDGAVHRPAELKRPLPFLAIRSIALPEPPGTQSTQNPHHRMGFSIPSVGHAPRARGRPDRNQSPYIGRECTRGSSTGPLWRRRFSGYSPTPCGQKTPKTR